MNCESVPRAIGAYDVSIRAAESSELSYVYSLSLLEY